MTRLSTALALAAAIVSGCAHGSAARPDALESSVRCGTDVGGEWALYTPAGSYRIAGSFTVGDPDQSSVAGNRTQRRSCR